jgi:hypothetical protein
MKTASPTFILVNVAVVGVLTALVFMNTCCTGDQTLSPCTSSEQCNLSPGGECLPSPLGENLCAYIACVGILERRVVGQVRCRHRRSYGRFEVAR